MKTQTKKNRKLTNRNFSKPVMSVRMTSKDKQEVSNLLGLIRSGQAPQDF